MLCSLDVRRPRSRFPTLGGAAARRVGGDGARDPRAGRRQAAGRDSRVFGGISPLRFFSALRELPPQLLDRATHPDAKRELQLVAVAGSEAEEKIIGGARYAATATDGDCEFAVAVVDEWHGRGVARLLLETLMRAARTRGFARMEGYILATNAAMLGLAERLRFATTESPEGPTVCLVRRDLGTVA
jgi:GNAT superfamily N-acetyltransferase